MAEGEGLPSGLSAPKAQPQTCNQKGIIISGFPW